ncbi:MAG: Ribosomal RNA small subunit methyltransferase E [Phycisphaerae bacterium]|nr:Ribosomal RNA small subunit methyltransferase E [Phycisphaerae bacterium]
MAQPRFHVEQLAVTGSKQVLPRAAAHHARDVLRLTEGAEVILFDGAGHVATGHLHELNRHDVVVQINTCMHQPPDGRIALTLAVAWPKGDRQEFLVEKCTELGVAAIWPMVCRRSVVLPAERQMEKWRNWAIRAAEQAQRAWLPEITPPQTFDNVISRRAEFSYALLADPHATRIMDDVPIEAAQNILALVGPEGGFTEEELAAGEAAGLEQVRLRTPLLRVETAACAIAARWLV